MYFPGELRRIRKQLNISQTELAKKINISQGMISRIENKDVNPRFSVMEKISGFLENIEKKKENSIEGVMSKPVRYVVPEEKVGNALYLMKKYGYSQIPVIKMGVCVGSVNEKIIVQRILDGEGLSRLKRKKIEKIMSKSFPDVGMETGFENVVVLLKNNPAILVKESGVVKGIITRSDIL